ncbi:thermosome subunit [Sulfolobus acidocaldarius SUSAZ]|nr:thermosome subunit [Sulfolobus acidocaldarius SUSAZ]
MYSLYKEGTKEQSGVTVIKNNILAVRTLAEMLKSSLGPKGMDKMLISGTSDVTITNDGVTIVKEMDIQHPAAKLVVEAAKAQDAQVGDGTTSAVVLSGFLADEADKLIDQKIHPIVIIEGYKKALQIALETGKSVGLSVNPQDRKSLKNVAFTALSSKFFANSETLNRIIDVSIDAILSVVEKVDNAYKVDLSNIKFIKKKGESVDETTLVRGYILDKEVAHENMPRRVEKAKIAILDFPLEVEKPEISAKMSFNDPSQIKLALEEQAKYIRSMIDTLEKIGAKVVITQKGMDDIALHFLAKKGIMGIKNVSRSDVEKVAKATGAKIISSLKDVSSEDLGQAELVEERKIGNSKVILIEDSKDTKAVTVLIRGSSEIIMDELERSFQDSLNAIKNVIESPYIVGGGGSYEVELAMKIREESKKVGGKEQLAIEAFANALEEITSTLAGTAGMDEIDTVVKLRNLHASGMKFAGINVLKGKVEEDVTKENIIDPLIVKESVLKSATEAVTALLKIDDYIAASPTQQRGAGEQQMPQYPMG